MWKQTDLEVRWLSDFRSVNLFHWLFQVGLGCGLARILGFILWRVGRPKSLSILGLLWLFLLLRDISSHLRDLFFLSLWAVRLLLSTVAQAEDLCWFHFTEVPTRFTIKSSWLYSVIQGLSKFENEWAPRQLETTKKSNIKILKENFRKIKIKK